jgi:flagellar basal-body rod modification protein FlgD
MSATGSGLQIPGLTAPAPQVADRTGPRQLGQDDFLRLLTTQLTSQDPLSPMDNNAFVAQLAQFSTVSGVTETNAGVSRLAALMADLVAGGSRNAAPAWIGRTVVPPDGQAGAVAAVTFGADGAMSLLLDDGRSVASAEVTAIS